MPRGPLLFRWHTSPMSCVLRNATLLWVLWWSAAVPAAAPPAWAPIAEPLPAPHAKLEVLRQRGDLAGQRGHLWKVLLAITTPREGQAVQRSGGTTVPAASPAFAGWYNKAEVLAAGERLPFPGMPAAATASATAGGIVRLDAPVLTFVHFNEPAYQHVRQHGLQVPANLEGMRRSGARSIPPWPREAVTLMSAWWPVAATGLTPLPVWDPAARHRPTGSNSYVNWPRVVAVDPVLPAGSSGRVAAVEFAGRTSHSVKRVGLDRFVRVAVDAAAAARLMAEPASRKAVLIALGRPLQAGDALVLVALHVMTAELPGGLWGTFWWHDAPEAGPFAAGRPAAVADPWRQFLMDVAFDAVLPREADGSPRVCFNPWFDAPFPADGQGNGLRSNCVNCHSRASFPALSFLPVRRGAPDLEGDPAYAPGQLRVGQVWALAHAGDLAGNQHQR